MRDLPQVALHREVVGEDLDLPAHLARLWLPRPGQRLGDILLDNALITAVQSMPHCIAEQYSEIFQMAVYCCRISALDFERSYLL